MNTVTSSDQYSRASGRFVESELLRTKEIILFKDGKNISLPFLVYSLHTPLTSHGHLLPTLDQSPPQSRALTAST